MDCHRVVARRGEDNYPGTGRCPAESGVTIGAGQIELDVGVGGVDQAELHQLVGHRREGPLGGAVLVLQLTGDDLVDWERHLMRGGVGHREEVKPRDAGLRGRRLHAHVIGAVGG